MELGTINATEATAILRQTGMKISPTILRDGIEQKVFPFGDVVRSRNGSPVCFIYRKKLMEWIEERAYQNGK